MTELATLERKRLSDLHPIASQLGIEQYRKYRKPELAELIFKVATEQASGQSAPVAPTPETTIESTESSESNGSTPAAVEIPEAPEPQKPQPENRQNQNGQNNQNGRQDNRQNQNGSRDNNRRQKGQRAGGQQGAQEADGQQEGQAQTGILDVLPDGFGFLRTKGYTQSKGDVYVSTSQIKRFNLRRGDYITGQIRPARDGEKYPAMVRIETVNEAEPQKGRRRVDFDDLTPLFPQDRLRLEWKPNDIAPRVIDLVAPIGKGQRGLI
ncbi:MAG: Rho termination factor N-terminal domain-containing protein, partial [Rubrobacter sp.]